MRHLQNRNPMTLSSAGPTSGVICREEHLAKSKLMVETEVWEWEKVLSSSWEVGNGR